jgi:alpha-beta hydrolase superfamily lysophospholipase
MKTMMSLKTHRIMAGLLLALTLAGMLLPADAVHAKPWYQLDWMADPILDQVLLFYLGHTWQQMSDVGECLDTASRVDPTDPRSWTREWTVTADRLSAAADTCEAHGHLVSAGEIRLRAANYYMAALHRHFAPGTPEVVDLANNATRSFARAVELLEWTAEAVAIPYAATTLPGWLFLSPRAEVPAPVLIVHQGRDGWAEHCLSIAQAAVRRGYHCLLFDGPGQGKVLRLQGLPFRPDWENVVIPVVDFLVARREIDPARIGLVGISMGGALAPRAAAFEKRLKVCVANPGVLSWRDLVWGFFDAMDPSLSDLWRVDPPAFDATVAGISEQMPFVDWGVSDTMWKHGSTTPSEMMAAMEPYTNERIVDRITCRMLVMDGTADDFSQGRRLFDALPGPKDYLLFIEQDTGQQHCQVGALGVSNQRLFDWLDTYLK